MTKITSITGRAILDSRGIPTVEAQVKAGKAVGAASVPSGRSTGRHEAVELRDGDSRWNGHGVSKAVSHINVQLSGALIGLDVTDQAALDEAMRKLDGTSNLKRLGANAILAVSLACLKAAALVAKKPLWKHVADISGVKTVNRMPLPLVNLINGGEHAPNNLAIQEFMLVPHGFDSFSEAVRAADETYMALGGILAARNVSRELGDEGGYAPDGYAPDLDSNFHALELLVEAIEKAGHKPGEDISLAMDIAANSFQREGGYFLSSQSLTAEQLVTEYDQLSERFPLVSVEDPVGEADTAGWQAVYKRLGSKLQIIGDDLTVTDAKRITKAVKNKEINGVILKPNQVGTYTDAAAAHVAAKKAEIVSIASHRSGETTDDWIADLAVGWQCEQVKIGSVARGERVAKYNRLLEIEQALGSGTEFAGRDFLKAQKGSRG
ncbi:phosphopyruvate hydratase [Patescibacteria group bacterium]|nr:phosphopyruvate hydratase [Patescibacteria group bacterium]